MKKFPPSVRGVCLGLALLACVCAVLSGALFADASAASLPVVTVTASDAAAAELGADTASFTFRRTPSTSKSLNIYYKVGGTAAGAADYAALSGSVVIPAGASTAVVKVTPLGDAAVEGDETVSVTVSGNKFYAVGSTASASATIADNNLAPTPEPTPTPTPTPDGDPYPQNGLYVSTRGSDTNDGATPETALRSISAAAARAVPGTTVFIEGGTYFEQVVTKAGGLAGHEIVFRSFNGTAVIDGSSLGWAPGSNQNQGLVELRHPYVRLSGLKVVNSKNTGVLLDADDLTVEGCEVAESQRHAVSTHTSRQTNYPGLVGTMIRNVVIKDNLVYRAALTGVGQAISLIADGFVITGNTVRDNPKEGIDIWLGAKRGEVSGNVVYGNNAPGIYVDGASYVRIHSNRVFNNTKGIGVTSEDENYSTHDVWVYNNVVYDNAEAGLFLWDEGARPGRRGVQGVLVAHNTLAGNRHSVYLAGEGNTGEIVNNLGQSSAASVRDESVRSSVAVRKNVWLPGLGGFAAAARKDFRLKAGSPAVDRGVRLPALKDDRGRTFPMDSDFDGAARPRGSAPDAGAYEYR
jgi:parallel beta-helix repeat protein